MSLTWLLYRKMLKFTQYHFEFEYSNVAFCSYKDLTPNDDMVLDIGVELYFLQRGLKWKFFWWILFFVSYYMRNNKNMTSLTLFTESGHFHVEILCNKIDRMSYLGHFKANCKAIALPACPKLIIFMWTFFATKLSVYNRVLAVSKIWVVRVGVKILFPKATSNRYSNIYMIEWNVNFSRGLHPTEKAPGVDWDLKPPKVYAYVLYIVTGVDQ